MTTYVGGYDFTTDLNSITLGASVEEKDNTTFGTNGFRSRIGGLRDVNADLSGFWQSDESDAVDPEAFGNLGVVNRPVTVTPTGAEGETAYMFQGGKFTYEMFGQIGEVTPFTVNMMGTSKDGLVRGALAKAKGSVTPTGAIGSVVELGAADDDQFVYAVLHVFSAGTTITVQVQSDDSETFSGATTVGTIGPITTTGGTWMTRIAGPVTDTYWRLNVSAITGTFVVAGAIAIQ
ncbi:hypothetical protein [Microbispora bryophytorum]|uniref:hypothetical protein n=1 Tax=Microbispora bryophytorum TaxID=1460882 RepID=UPI0033D6A66D